LIALVGIAAAVSLVLGAGLAELWLRHGQRALGHLNRSIRHRLT
jgi:hypothetical protein